MMKRVFLIVLDSCGIGYEPDADLFGDVGANTLKRISASLCMAITAPIIFYSFYSCN